MLEPPAFPQGEKHEDCATAEQQPDDGGHPQPLWGVGLGLTKPHVPERITP